MAAAAPSHSRFTFPAPSNTPNTHSSRQPPSPVHHYAPTYTNQQSSGNAHPYAIRTTSTALLSRSNSITQDLTKHHYVPPSPKLDHSATQQPERSFGTTRAHGSGHRYSRSLSNDLGPRPLPSPPTAGTPSFAPVEQGDLPPNPKLWSPTQLSTYLTTALRVRGASDLPGPIARDIATFVIRAHINGKAFLRLTENDLQGYHLNPLWCASLLAASRNLRQNVLKGRIWGFGDNEASPDSPTNGDLPEPTRSRLPSSPNAKKPRYSDAIVTDPESLYESAESSSSLDLSRPPTEAKDVTPRSRISARFRSGRVKGMVKSWEVRSGSESGSCSESSEAEEDSGIPNDNGGTVKRLLPAPPLPADGFGTITPPSDASGSPKRPLPAPPLHLPPDGIASFSAAMPVTPPLHIPEEELSMDQLLKMNGIQPERTRAGKRKAARAKAVHPQLSHDGTGNEENSLEGGGPGVEAWLAPEGVTVKKISGSGKVLPVQAGGVGLENLFEQPQTDAPQAREEALEAELDKLRAALSETEALAAQLAQRLEDFEGRVVQMGILEDEIAIQMKENDTSGHNASLSDATLADEEDRNKVVLKLLREENEELKRKVEILERLQETSVKQATPTPEHSVVPPEEGNIMTKALGFLLPLSPSSSAQRARASQISKAIEDHLRVRSLPGYLVLVGIGVCVVCLKVLGRRIVSATSR